VTILPENGIKAYCGYHRNWDMLRIGTNTTGFGANATYSSALGVEMMGG
jgi:hypothetical protein